MAHAAKLGALTEELINVLASKFPKHDQAEVGIHKESILRALRYHNYPRTNQFDITNRLDGLEEKFRIYNEDLLADALRERLDTLSELKVKWAPEILHLLLELSDKPVSKSKLEDLELLKEPDPDTGPHLRWEDLVPEDPLLQDTYVWQNVDFGAESSDADDGYEDTRSELSTVTETTRQSSVDEEHNRRYEYCTIDTSTKVELDSFCDSQFWQKTPSIDGVKLKTVKTPITELQAIREVLFMLSGLPTSLFEVNPERPTIFEPCKKFNFKHASNDAYIALTGSLAVQGSALLILRSWTQCSQSTPLLQIFQNSILDRLSEFDKRLSEIQRNFVSPTRDTVVSLLHVQAHVSTFLNPLVKLSEIVKKIDSERYAHSFRYLEMLYDMTCTSQIAGDDKLYSFMGTIFFECFQVFLRPIRTWMEEGELTQGDKLFFISETSAQVDLASIWHSRFTIRKSKDGILHAPRFLQTAVSKIFTTGKSVVILKSLNQFHALKSDGNVLEPRLDFDTVCKPSELTLAPFPELFDSAFASWVQSKHRHASFTLQRTLFDSCGLHTSLDALACIYFMADGATASGFTNPIFDRLDTLDTSWNDHFTLNELARITFGFIPSVSPERLRIDILPLARKHRGVANCRRAVKTLSALELNYRLSWPIQIIVTSATITSYKKIFTFLVQVRRSSRILSRQRLVTDTLTNSSSSDERATYYSLRTRLLWFTQTLYYYLTSLVLEPCSQKMRGDLKAAEDVDTMIHVHSSYIKSVIDQSLMGNKLELIHKTILKILDLGIKLEDAQASNSAANKEALEQQQEMMDLSMASLGLPTPSPSGKQYRTFSKSVRQSQQDPDPSSDEDDQKDIAVDLSILSSSFNDGQQEILYIEKLKKMKADFDRMVRFVASGLKGVARASSGDEARSWDTLGEMLESGISVAVTTFR